MKKGFDRIAGFYDFLSRIVFGKSIRDSQLCYLNQLGNCNTVLVLGGGTGWWLNELLQSYPYLKITFLDSSLEMIRIAKEKLLYPDKVQFVCGTQESIESNNKFDAVVLFYFLDLFHENSIPVLIHGIKNHLNPNAVLLASDFVNEKKWHSIMLQIMYLFFRYSTGLRTKQLPNWRECLTQNGFDKMKEKSFYKEFISATVYRQK